MKYKIQKYYIKDNGAFPNSVLPVVHYMGILHLPMFFPSRHILQLFQRNGWTNNWKDGIYTFHHYHSTTHEAMGVCKGQTTVRLGGEKGPEVVIGKGDVLIIPAGVAHKNMGGERQVICIGGYPGGREYDMNYGKPAERPQADANIAALPVPATDPVLGADKGVNKFWAGQ